MTTPARRIRLCAEVEHRHDADAFLKTAGDAVLVHRGRPRSLVIACPDGCGEVLAVNLDPRSGKAWRIYRKGSAISLSPSVWRDGGCESHFIVWRGQIIWGSRFEYDNQELAYDQALETEVLEALSAVQFRSPQEIADQLNEIPWDVMEAARNLVSRGLAEYGSGAQRQSIRRKTVPTSEPAEPQKLGVLERLWRFLFGESK
jgi:hypothetical protein